MLHVQVILQCDEFLPKPGQFKVMKFQLAIAMEILLQQTHFVVVSPLSILDVSIFQDMSV